jgi:hypothetical protein
MLARLGPDKPDSVRGGDVGVEFGNVSARSGPRPLELL